MKFPTILLVDDDRIITLMFQKYLAKHGFDKVITAHDGSDAVVKSRLYKPDFVVMDYHLPGNDTGRDAVQKILGFSNPGIIYLTGTSSRIIENRVEDTNPLAVLIKPCKPMQLVDVLSEAWSTALAS